MKGKPFVININNSKDLYLFRELIELIKVSNFIEVDMETLEHQIRTCQIGNQIYMNDWEYELGIEFNSLYSQRHPRGKKGPILSLFTDLSKIYEYCNIPEVDVITHNIRREIFKQQQCR